MGSMVIRNIPDDVVERFKARAKTKGQSAEQMARDVIAREAGMTREEAWATMDEIRSRSKPVDLERRCGSWKKPVSNGTRRRMGRGSTVIIDASVAVPWLIETPFAPAARRLKSQIGRAPALILIETTNVLLKYFRAGQIRIDDVGRAIAHCPLP